MASQDMTVHPLQQIPTTPRDPYTGPDMFTTPPNEMLLKIFSFLHAPGDGKWTDKTDLKAVNSIRHKKLCAAVREELFHYMTLKFSYQGQMHNGAWVWETPSLVQLIQNQPDLAGFIRGVRVQIKPVPQRKGGEKLSRWDLPNLYRQDCWRYLFHWNNVLLAGASVAANEPTYGFVDALNTTMTLLPDFRRRDIRANQDDLFCHLFGMPPFPHNGVDNTVKFPNDVAQIHLSTTLSTTLDIAFCPG